MRPCPLHRIGIVARVAILCVTAGCVSIWAIAAWSPGILRAAGDGLRARWSEQILDRFRAVSTLDDAAARLQALQRWSRELRDVRKLDAMAPVLRYVEGELVRLALQVGDGELALHHARRLAEFDDRDVEAVARYGSLLAARDPKQAISLLTENLAPARRDPAALTPLLDALLARGEHERAAEALCATAASHPGDVWRIRWSAAPVDGTWFLFRQLPGDAVEARLCVDAPIAQLRITLPPFRSLALRDAELVIEDAAGERRIAFDADSVETVGLQWSEGALVANGSASAELVFRDVQAAVPGCWLSIHARLEERLSDALITTLLGGRGTQIARGIDPETRLAHGVAKLRARACLESGFTLPLATLAVADAPADPRGAIQLDAFLRHSAESFVLVVPPMLTQSHDRLELVPLDADGSALEASVYALARELTIRAPRAQRLRLRLVPG